MSRFQQLVKGAVTASAAAALLSAGVAYAQVTPVSTLVEPFGQAANNFIDAHLSGDETPRRSTGSGFTWGGYCVTSATTRYISLHQSGYLFFGFTTMPGIYGYTIFDTEGGNTANRSVNLADPGATISFSIQRKVTNANFSVGHLVRSADTGVWYVSESINAGGLAVGATLTSVVQNLDWFELNGPSNTMLNALAPSDEAAISFSGTATTEAIGAIDGGGIYIYSGLEPYDTGIDNLTWFANLPEVGVSASKAHPLAPEVLLIGPADGPNPAVPPQGTLTIENIGQGTLTVSGLELNNTDSYIDWASGSAPSLPISLTAGQTADLTFEFNPTVALDSRTSASLTVTSDAAGVAGTEEVFYINGTVVKTSSIFEEFVTQGDLLLAPRNGGNENPSSLNPPPDGTGFTWGGYTVAKANDYQTEVRITTTGASGRLLFFSTTAGTPDANNSANAHGSYAYTIFDSTGGNTPDYSLDLRDIVISPDQAAPAQEIRYLIRDANAQWFISQDVINISNITSSTKVNVDNMTGWYRVNAAAETDMNELDSDAQVAIDEPTTLAVGTPVLTGVTGGGVYIETGDTETAERRVLTVPSMAWVERPSENDRLTLTTADVTAENLAPIPYRRLAVFAIDTDITVGQEVVLDSLTLTYTPADGAVVDAGIYNETDTDNMVQGDSEMTTSSLTNGSVELKFYPEPVTFVDGTNRKLLVGVLLDESAVGNTYTFSLAGADFVVNEDIGGTGDGVIIDPADPATASVTIEALDFVDTVSLVKSNIITETWDAVTEPIQPATYDLSVVSNGTVAGSDLAWTYAEQGGVKALNDTGTGFKEFGTGDLGLGAETQNLTANPLPPFGYLNFNTSLASNLQTGNANARVVELDFVLEVLDTNYRGEVYPFSFYTASSYNGMRVDLNAADDDALRFQLNPMWDPGYHAFSLAKVSNGGETAPAPISAYDDADGVGTYAVNLKYAPYDAEHTMVRATFLNVDTSDSLVMNTIIDGAMPALINGVQLGFGKLTNAFISELELNVYGEAETAADQTWSLYE